MLDKFLSYTELADKIVLDLYLNQEIAIPEVDKLFSHILSSQHIWLNRIEGLEQRYEPFSIHPKGLFAELYEENFRRIRSLLTKDLEKEISYQNTKGESFVSSIADILLHVASHSTYHRAQIVLHMKNKGIAPPLTDYIVLNRTGLL